MATVIKDNASEFGSVDAMDQSELVEYLTYMRQKIFESGEDIGDFGILGLSSQTKFLDASYE
jgi:hypothetical protein